MRNNIRRDLAIAVLSATWGLVATLPVVARGESADPLQGPSGPVPEMCAKQGWYDFISNGNKIVSVSFSPDGKFLAAALENSQPFIWDARTGEKVRTLKSDGRAKKVDRLRYAPDGLWIAGSASDKYQIWIILWNATTGVVEKTFGQEGHYSKFEFSPTAPVIAAVGMDHSVALWNYPSAEQVSKWPGDGNVFRIAFSPDGKNLAIAILAEPTARILELPSKPPVSIWSVETWKRVREIGKPGLDGRGVAFSPDGQYLAVGDYPCSLWDTRTWQKVRSFPGLTYSFSPNGKRLASEKGLWDVESGRRIALIEGPKDSERYERAFSPDGRYLAIVLGPVVRLWQVDRLPPAPAKKSPALPSAPRSTGDKALDAIPARLEGVRFRVWNSLTHAAENQKEADEVLAILEALRLLGTGDRSALDAAGGLGPIAKDLLRLTKSDDNIVRGNAVILMGIVGDRTYAPELVKMMEKRGGIARQILQRRQEEISACAAVALGLMEATEEAPRIAKLLTSREESLRAAAATALGLMKSTAQKEAVAKLLDDPSAGVRMSAASALAGMGAKEFAPRIAKLLGKEGVDTESRKSTIAMLVALGAKEYSREIGALLEDEFSAGDAAAGLAFLGEVDYAPKIAILLRRDDPLRQRDALLALGILRAREFEGEAAHLLDADESDVICTAAISLILMESKAYGARAVQMFEEWFDGEVPDYLFRYLPAPDGEKGRAKQMILDSLANLRSAAR